MEEGKGPTGPPPLGPTLGHPDRRRTQRRLRPLGSRPPPGTGRLDVVETRRLGDSLLQDGSGLPVILGRSLRRDTGPVLRTSTGLSRVTWEPLGSPRKLGEGVVGRVT